MYKITENPPPFKKGISTVNSIDEEESSVSRFEKPDPLRRSNYLLKNYSRSVNIININTNNNSTNNNDSSTNEIGKDIGVKYDFYSHSGKMERLTGISQLLCDGKGPIGFTRDINPPVWNTADSSFVFTAIQQVYQILVYFKADTNVLGSKLEFTLRVGPYLVQSERVVLDKEISNDFVVVFYFTTAPSILGEPGYILIKTEEGAEINIWDIYMNIIKLK
jgi:hypothetical protein